MSRHGLGLNTDQPSSNVAPSDASQASVLCIVLNWNGWKDTVRCLEALSRIRYQNLSVVVVDNGSTDDSVDQIRASFPNVPIILSERNLGFGAGNNLGIRYGLEQNFDYIWLLNNDTEPFPEALTELVAKASANPRIGAIGSVLMYAHDPATVQAWGGGKVNCWTGRALHAVTPQDDSWFDYITAASMLLPRRALEDIGLFDETFFLYWEDGDLSFRLRERGWQLGVASGSIVLHKENASSGRSRRVVDRFATASGIRFMLKHAKIPWLSIAIFLTLRIGWRLLRGDFRRAGDVLGGVWDYFVRARQQPSAGTKQKNRPLSQCGKSAPDDVRKNECIVYGAFKGMGDLMAAVPVIRSELDQGMKVVLLVFPQISSFVDLIEFGSNKDRLEVCRLPDSVDLQGWRRFFLQMSRLTPNEVLVSPHAPAVASSWKIPLLLWFLKRCYWPKARLIGADTEKLSLLFDVRLPIDRRLPLAAREWEAYSMLRRDSVPSRPPSVLFKDAIRQSRQERPVYDILIHPGATAGNRKWPFNRYEELLKRIPEKYSIAIAGLPQDIDLLKAVLPTDGRVTFLTGTLEEAIKAIGSARVALTMDSGTMFFANALEVPTVALFGPTNPANVIVQGSYIVPIYEPRWPCQPCASPTCYQRAVYCMESIEPSNVAERVLQVLESDR